MKTVPLLMITATLSVNAGGNVIKEIIEKKYDSPLERFDLISFSATTKILRFDFELTGGKSWWVSFNVIEVKKDGTPPALLDLVKSGDSKSYSLVGTLSKISFEEFTSIIRPVLLTKFIGASKVDSFPVTKTHVGLSAKSVASNRATSSSCLSSTGM